MPTVHREDGFRVVIYPNDHLPRHVHVRKDKGEVIIWLGDETEDPSIRLAHEVSDKNAERALEIVRVNQVKLIAEWDDIHG